MSNRKIIFNLHPPPPPLSHLPNSHPIASRRSQQQHFQVQEALASLPSIRQESADRSFLWTTSTYSWHSTPSLRGTFASAKVSQQIHLRTPVLFQISLSSVYADSTLFNQNAEQSTVSVTQTLTPAKLSPPLRSSDGSCIMLKYPENCLFRLYILPLVFVGITMTASDISQFCAFNAKMTNTFWHRNGFSKAFALLLLIVQTALFVPGVRGVASERVSLFF